VGRKKLKRLLRAYDLYDPDNPDVRKYSEEMLQHTIDVIEKILRPTPLPRPAGPPQCPECYSDAEIERSQLLIEQLLGPEEIAKLK
jgi:hypothetical protein